MNWVIKHLYYTFLGNSQNYQLFGAVDHLMNYRPLALGDSSSVGPQHLGADTFDWCPEWYEIVVYSVMPVFISWDISSVDNIWTYDEAMASE